MMGHPARALLKGGADSVSNAKFGTLARSSIGTYLRPIIGTLPGKTWKERPVGCAVEDD